MNRYTRVDQPDISPFLPLFEAMKYTGPLCLNFKYTNQGPKLFEMNPRFGGTLICNYFHAVLSHLTHVWH
jgi:biotin carboxylase